MLLGEAPRPPLHPGVEPHGACFLGADSFSTTGNLGLYDRHRAVAPRVAALLPQKQCCTNKLKSS